MNLHRSPFFFFVFLLCPAAVAVAADTTVIMPLCEVKEPSEWQTRVDREPAEDDSAETGGVERDPAERERVPATPARAPLAVPTPLAQLTGDAVFRQAYADVYGILSTDNGCSRFYGGAAPAAYVFNQLAATFKPGRVGGSSMAGQMSGEVVHITHAPTGLKFRLFEKARLNTIGPFYRRQGAKLDERVPRIGNYAPDTREARALILLHELGHVVKGAGTGWLLGDDGDDAELSERNTELVETHCGAQLKALGSPPPPPLVAKTPAREQPGRDTSEQ